MDICFLILHYKTNEHTDTCIEYIIRNCDTESFHIVVVDNASPMESWNMLLEKYDSDNRVTLLRNEKNLGFARGNNVGFKYAKEKFNPQFICMINNDAYLLDKNIFEKLKKEFLISKFAVAGPQITTSDGRKTSNPFICSIPSIDWLKYMIRKRKFEILCARFGLYEKVCPFTTKILKKLNILQPPQCVEVVPMSIDSRENETIFESKAYYVGLHGAALFFSPEYIKMFDGIDDRTFLGGEELILYTKVLCSNLVTVYLPDIHMYHVVGGSSTQIANKKRTPSVFYHSLQSYILSKEILVTYQKRNNCELHMDMVRQGKVSSNSQITRS